MISWFYDMKLSANALDVLVRMPTLAMVMTSGIHSMIDIMWLLIQITLACVSFIFIKNNSFIAILVSCL